MNLSDINELDFNNIGSWPWAAKVVLLLLAMAAVGAGGYWYIIKDQREALAGVEREEEQLRAEFQRKQSVMANIESYQQQLQELEAILAELLEQLPSRTEMPNLIDDISELGRRNGLVFQLFKPGNEERRDFYVARPINLEARATYHEFGDFISDVSALDRIVTLENARVLNPSGRAGADAPDGVQTIAATLQIYRYLEENEIPQDEQQ
ncbi:MAG: type 4a pilus biogenesis protein PilO [Candidatus Competibacterales bacterium]